MKRLEIQHKVKKTGILVKAGSLYFIGNVLDRLLVFFMIPIFTRLLSTEEYGIVSTYLSWVGILTIIVGLSFHSCVRNAYIEFKEDIQAFMSSVLSLSFLVFIGITIGTYFICLNYFKEVDLKLVMMCLFQAYMTFVINYISAYYMMTYSYIKRVLLLIVPNCMTIILSLILIKSMENDLHMGRILAYFLVQIAVGGIVFIKILGKGKRFFKKQYWKYAIKISMPLVLHGLSVIILAQADRIMITYYIGASETAIYSLVYNFAMILTVIQTAIEGIWIPWFYEKMQNEAYDKINHMAKEYVSLMTVLAIGLIFIAPDILKLATPQSYWEGIYMIPPIVLSSYMIFLYSLPVNLEYYHAETKMISRNTVGVASLNIILNAILLPRYGEISACVVTVVCYALAFMVHYRVGRKLTPTVFPGKIFLQNIGVILLMTIMVYTLMEQVLWRWIIALGVAVGYLINTYLKYSRNKRGKQYESSSFSTD